MASVAMSLFCDHKRLRTACATCTPTLRPPSALREEEERPRARRR